MITSEAVTFLSKHKCTLQLEQITSVLSFWHAERLHLVAFRQLSNFGK